MGKQEEVEQRAAYWCVELSAGVLSPQMAAELKAWIDADPCHLKMLDALTEANEFARILFRGKKPSCQ